MLHSPSHPQIPLGPRSDPLRQGCPSTPVPVVESDIRGRGGGKCPASATSSQDQQPETMSLKWEKFSLPSFSNSRVHTIFLEEIIRCPRGIQGRRPSFEVQPGRARKVKVRTGVVDLTKLRLECKQRTLQDFITRRKHPQLNANERGGEEVA
ncbi:hypothetical protein HNY73_015908 [Argiope bruennichi]|uniref:Uncharacterized protein n=1 Tax=Argiope bruennichi TaxID=94029 RepID=A0A8T0EI86_ARGBR|nr:hypothetical protein HNY73_015908 [Argiope bruennichi]